jgi:predicted alternative tryptophan synthase beta-subunit
LKRSGRTGWRISPVQQKFYSLKICERQRGVDGSGESGHAIRWISQQATNLNEEGKAMVYEIDWIEPVKTGAVWID